MNNIDANLLSVILTQKDRNAFYSMQLVGRKNITYDQRISFKFQEAELDIHSQKG